jgi:crossover junction endodeoxyribonuclease RusA
MEIQFTVYGTPQPQGSTKGFVYQDKKSRKMRAAITTDNAKLKPWRQDAYWTALSTMRAAGAKIFDRKTPVAVQILFVFSQPKSAKNRKFPTVKPDIDKLERACLDAMTGVCYEDDSQVVSVRKDKAYGSPERVEITVKEKSDEVSDGPSLEAGRA